LKPAVSYNSSAVRHRRIEEDDTMDDEPFTPAGPPPPTGSDSRQRRRYLLSVAAALLGIAFAAAACSSGPSSPSVQGAGSGTTTPTTGASTANQGAPTLTPAQRAAELAYSECMRSHGVPSFPDPNSQGQLLIQGGPGSSLDPKGAAFQNAQKACQSKQPKPTAAQQAQAQQNALRQSQCMRAHGIKDYPDPSTSGGRVSLSINGSGGGDLNPNNPLFQAAQKACMPNAPKLPSGTKGGNATTGGGSSGIGSGVG
jgi:hypothetical protein